MAEVIDYPVLGALVKNAINSVINLDENINQISVFLDCYLDTLGVFLLRIDTHSCKESWAHFGYSAIKYVNFDLLSEAELDELFGENYDFDLYLTVHFDKNSEYIVGSSNPKLDEVIEFTIYACANDAAGNDHLYLEQSFGSLEELQSTLTNRTLAFT